MGLRLRRKGKTDPLVGRLVVDVHKHSGHSHADNGDNDDDPFEGDDVARDEDEDESGDSCPVPGEAYTVCLSSTICDLTASRSMRSLMRRCKGPLGQDTTSRSAEAGTVVGDDDDDDDDDDDTGPEEETIRTIWSKDTVTSSTEAVSSTTHRTRSQGTDTKVH